MFRSTEGRGTVLSAGFPLVIFLSITKYFSWRSSCFISNGSNSKSLPDAQLRDMLNM